MNHPYDILFETVRIGPVLAPNRFYQVPHCNGFGYRMPQGMAAMRGMKAAGGWGVVCTEEVEIHHSSDLSPYLEGRLWDDDDIPALALMAEAVHKHGSLAGIELLTTDTTPQICTHASPRLRRARWERLGARTMIPCKRVAWIKRIFAMYANGTEKPHCALNGLASISFIVMPGMG
jgi:hypothetical protein